MFRSKWPNYMGGYAFFVVRDIVQWNSSLTLCITQTEYLLYLELYIRLEAYPKKSYTTRSLLPISEFVLDEMLQQTASKFAIFYIYENPKLPFLFFISCY